ncbi:MAG: hypothetical protein II629_07310, partial [Ruminococcus sp.]|nr:hypothetical protein [Ruminococcus sp.]
MKHRPPAAQSIPQPRNTGAQPAYPAAYPVRQDGKKNGWLAAVLGVLTVAVVVLGILAVPRLLENRRNDQETGSDSGSQQTASSGGEEA